MKIDTHIHSKFSKDSIMPLEDIIKYSRIENLEAIAISDHDEIGVIEAIKNVEHEGIIVIPAEEVSTTKGHIVALGISEYIKPLQTPQETVDQIHDNGGVAIAAHPYCYYRSGVGDIVRDLDVDAMETKNSRFILGMSNYMSKVVSQKYDIPAIGASDAHFIEGIGSCYTEIPQADSVDEILKYIKKGMTKACGIRTPMKAIIREVIRKKGHRTKPKTE
ncbi:MAG: PHP domain-containing protein [Methanosphaera sp.]|uniref:PHP domain-containing protein n=1 Tax=Methanosphaera sp. TaxID=2666342 RepID=UPI0025E51573|nr:PHP domain-containing protein [Methanosphaera sp.]MCI5866822.1 PHP domain-containing protein [Methanosphaera sp.]MDD6534329.1 PHP domain-containing protein [Methanosphaera sp.]MDY3955266.1 PHP domain-containing protein [Methanosphaera sp.]